MDTELLNTFVTVARTASITAAARDLHLVQSTVTSRVQQLEKTLGQRLFDRRPHGMALTGVGTEALTYAHDVIDAVDRLRSLSNNEDLDGEVTICAPESVCAFRLPELAAQLADHHPNIEVTIEPAGTSTTMTRVRERSADLGIIVDEVERLTDIDATLIGHEEIVVVGSPKNAAIEAGLSTDERFYLLEEGCRYSDRAMSTIASNARVTRFGSIEAVRSCAEAGLGLSVLPTVSCASSIAVGTLVEMSAQPAVPVMVVHDPRRWQSPAAIAVRSRLLELYR